MKILNKLIEWSFLLLSTGIVLLFLGVIVFDIVSKGSSSLSWEFVSQLPKKSMTQGGILPAILGTVMLTTLTALFCAIWSMLCYLP